MSFAGPFPVADAITRLQTQVGKLRHVGSAADLATALSEKPRTAPVAYVVKEERSDPATGASNGVLVQMCTATVQVVLFVRNYAQAGPGAGARAEMDTLIASVRAALLKWSPDNTRFFHGLTHVASRDEQYDGGWLVVQEVFQTRYPIEVRP